jgi:quinol monooxygenase YgiN
MTRLALAAVVAAVLGAPAFAQKPNPIIADVKAKLKNPDKPFTMVVVFKVKPGKEKAFVELVAAAKKKTRQEKGNLAYDLYQSAEQPEIYVNWEKWKNIDGLADHVKADYIVKLLKAVAELTEGGPEIKVIVPVD